MPDLTLFLAGLGAVVYLSLAATATKFYLKARRYRENGPDLYFEDVCQTVAAAKWDRLTDDDVELTDEFVDGADAVMAKLLNQGYGDSPEEMRAAYLAGGETPTVEADADDVDLELEQDLEGDQP